ncbi:(2Fe-2S) ferredoxin domain-containing protein [bacterium]|nr:(2Fe-2S) ferredoxin domain-containing protein [bacterium]MBU1072356.1 (2Fe-2S) ferredoxin domain-containing protein [bacterium]MBU1675277.1 (2Fe-2S) ferredoxin domain-containing protein [bacterium]
MLKQDLPFDAVAFVCTHQRPDGHPKPCCADRGGSALRQELREMAAERGLDARVGIFASGCLGGCELGPTAMTFPDGKMAFGLTERDLPALLEELDEGG